MIVHMYLVQLFGLTTRVNLLYIRGYRFRLINIYTLWELMAFLLQILVLNPAEGCTIWELSAIDLPISRMARLDKLICKERIRLVLIQRKPEISAPDMANNRQSNTSLACLHILPGRATISTEHFDAYERRQTYWSSEYQGQVECRCHWFHA